MTNGAKVAFLSRYKTFEQEAERTRGELAYWRQRAREEQEGDGGDLATKTRYYARMLITRYRACLASRLLLEDAIIRVPSPRERLLLRLHYVDGHTLETAAEKMDISARHAARLHKQALEAVTVPEFWPAAEQAAFEAALTRLTWEADRQEAA